MAEHELYVIQGKTLNNIASEVKTLVGISDKISPNEMSERLGQVNTDIETQADLIAQIQTALEGKVSGNVGKEEQEKTIDITENGITEVTPDEGKVLSKVTVNVEVEQSEGGEDDFIGIKYSNYSNDYLNIPKIADARSLDKQTIKSDRVLQNAFSNQSTNPNGGYFAYLEEVYLPENITTLYSTFANCTKLSTIHGNLSKIYNIDTAFKSCISLDINAVIAKMTKLKIIGNNSFRDCTQATEITLPATITNIYTSAFAGCTNLTKINCLFAEGSVTGQPWGATNAVVEYVTGV